MRLVRRNAGRARSGASGCRTERFQVASVGGCRPRAAAAGDRPQAGLEGIERGFPAPSTARTRRSGTLACFASRTVESLVELATGPCSASSCSPTLTHLARAEHARGCCRTFRVADPLLQLGRIFVPLDCSLMGGPLRVLASEPARALVAPACCRARPRSAPGSWRRHRLGRPAVLSKSAIRCDRQWL